MNEAGGLDIEVYPIEIEITRADGTKETVTLQPTLLKKLPEVSDGGS